MSLYIYVNIKDYITITPNVSIKGIKAMSTHIINEGLLTSIERDSCGAHAELFTQSIKHIFLNLATT